MKYKDFKLVTAPRDCFCFVCGERISGGIKKYTTPKARMPLCVLCMVTWVKERVELFKISRSKIKDGLKIG